MKTSNQKILPNLWFDNHAEEAVKFYTSIFPGSEVENSTRYPEAGKEIHQREPGSIMTISFHLMGYHMVALNGGPYFQFNPAISLFMINTEEEINRIWEQLLQGGSALMPLDAYDWSPKYGWLQDKFGLNWQLMQQTDQKIAPKICPLLFFTGKQQGKAEEAVNFYTSVFGNSKIEGILKYTEEDKNEFAINAVKHSQFKIEGETFMAMDSGMKNNHPFNEAISFIITCKDQDEIDRYWSKLSEGGDPAAQQCGWLKDQFGISWQVVPKGMEQLLNDPDKEKANRAMDAMMKMKKIEISALTEISI